MTPAAPRRLLILEPVPKHRNAIAPLIALALHRRWEVTVCGHGGLAEPLRARFGGAAGFAFLPLRAASIQAVALQPWTVVSLSTRVFQSKAGGPWTTGYWQGLRLQWACRRLLAGLAEATRLLLAIHQVASLTFAEPPVSRWYPLRGLEAELIEWARRRADGAWVIDHPLAEAARATFGYTERPLLVAPPACPTPDALAASTPPPPGGPDGLLRIVSIGRIELDRKAYDWLEAVPVARRGRIEISLLGKAGSEAERAVARRVRALGYQAPEDLSGTFVPQARFEALCAAAHLFLAPMKPVFGARRLGVHTTTGSLLDALQHGKALLLPRAIPVGPHFAESVVPYDDAPDLAATLIRFLDAPETLGAVQERARANTARFAPERQTFLEDCLALQRPQTPASMSAR